MSTAVRPPTTRASGGRTMVLLGVLLALAAGTIVMFVISHYTGASGSQETVVVAAKTIPTGTVLSSGASDATHMAISDAFTTKSVNTDDAPADAYVFTTQEDLNTLLNNQVVVSNIYTGEFLRKPDPRMVGIGNAAAGSMNLIDPSQIPPGSIITGFQLADKPFVVPGDHVDIIVTECNMAGSRDPGGCETQTTLQNVYIYTVRDNFVFIVLTHQQALQLKYLTETGKANLVLRKQGDSSPANTQPVDTSTIVKSFGF